jgi:hypothetical protein
VIASYLAELAAELARVGIRGRDARRVLAEAEAHLRESAESGGDEAAVRAFGSARSIAELVAAELATARARRAAISAFAALVPAGLLYAVLFVTLPVGSLDLFGGEVPGLGVAALVGSVLFPQVSFVAGMLALLRVIRLRDDRAQPAEELRVQRWRTAVALAAGGLTLVSLAVIALDFRSDVDAWWRLAALAGCATLLVPLLASAHACARATRPRPFAGEHRGDIRDDLSAISSAVPILQAVRLPAGPWRLALWVAGGAALCTAMAGVLAGDPLDGLLRSAFEAGAVLVCFVALGRRLALR